MYFPFSTSFLRGKMFSFGVLPLLKYCLLHTICLSLFCTAYGGLVSEVTWQASGLWSLLLSYS